MDKRYFDYCTVDRYFYDSPSRRPGAPGFEIATRPLPAGWRRTTADSWLVYHREDVALPRQGWKIHASACLDNAEAILNTIWSYCVPRGIAFKHLLGPRVLFVNNSKYAGHGSSAKLATIYPVDDDHCGRTLTELAPLLEGQPGAYILSDLRWGNGPLYVRYGGFARRLAGFGRGDPEPAIEDPSGRLVPDRREPAFRTPDWVTLPDFLAPHLAARNAITVAGIPYRVDRAVQFSNGGGVYVGTHKRTGEQVVLKEARPHAGLDASGGDAVGRLERERMILDHLAGLDFVPAVRDYFTVGEHHFLVQEFLDGTPLNKLFSRDFPLTGTAPDEAVLLGYTDWAMTIVDDVERNVALLREREVVFGDLHMFNIMVRPDGRTSMLDFETASLISQGRRPVLGHPAAMAPPDRTGFDIDRYSLACLRLALFLPMTTLFGLDPAKAAELALEIYQIYPVPDGCLDHAVRTITGGQVQPPADFRWPAARRSMVDGLLASATPDRDDRLFPGDIEQFTTGGLNLAYGAAGVLYALAVAGAGRYPQHERWLIERALARDPQWRIGFYDGLHGVAYALHHLGYPDEALSLIRRCQRGNWRELSLDLAGGLAGIGLNLDHFATVTGDPAWRAEAMEVAALVQSRLGTPADVAIISGGEYPYAGLMRGSSGPALLFIRLFESTGDKAYLDLATVALEQDLRRCVVQIDGSVRVNEGWRTMPYLATGSVGIGLVLQEFLVHRQDEPYLHALKQISLAAQAEFYVQSGLFNGRAGILMFHNGPYPHHVADPAAVVAKHVRGLARHALTHQGRLAFPGDQLYRLSMDLATGTAGVLLALSGGTLPFLTTRPDRGERGEHVSMIFC